MFRGFTGLYRAMEEGVALAIIANRHLNDPATMADAIRTLFSPRELAAVSVTFTPAVEVEELVAA